jgi:transaldolase
MEMFLDTASVKEIKEILPWGVISGITTNQKIFSVEKGVNFKGRVLEILSLVDAPLSVELTKTDASDDDLVAEAKEYASWNRKNVVIKVPMFGDGRGLRIANRLKRENIKTNITCLMSTSQVMLAAKVGATYASIFFCRVRDSGGDPVKVIQDSRRVIEESGWKTKIIVGSLRKPSDVEESAAAGGHVITIPYKIMVQMPFHQKTEDTIKEFDQAWLEFKTAEVLIEKAMA